MWLDSLPDDNDPLRQGDLLINITLPKLEPHIPLLYVQQQRLTTVPAMTSNVIVISQCCDNYESRYAVVARVGYLGNLQDRYVQALKNPEPLWDRTALSGYTPREFLIEPIPGILDDPGENRYLVAKLHQSATFSGDCTPLLKTRRARMTAEARRLLRIKLGVLWGRVEEDDVDELKRRGLPLGPSITYTATD